MKNCCFLFFLLAFCTVGSAQQKIAEIKAPPGFLGSNDAVGYYNKYSHRFVLCQQKGDSLFRTLYDSGFHSISQYSVLNKEITYRQKKKQKKRNFLTDLAAGDQQYEVYRQDKQLYIYKLNFEAGADQLTATITTGGTYADENLLAIMASGGQLRYMTHSKKENILLLYNCNPADGSTQKVLFNLPKTNLSDAEVQRYNSEIKLKLAKDMTDFSVSPMDKPNLASMPLDNHIFFDDRQAFLMVKMPYNIGYHVMRVLFNEGTITQKNLFINTLQEDYYCGDLDMKKALTVTIIDSMLIVGNNNAVNLQLHFFNAATLAPLASYNVNVTDSIKTIIHSKLKQKGTWGSQKESKELENAELYFRRKNTGHQYISVSARKKGKMTITSGSFIETGGTLQLFLTLTSMAFNVYAIVSPSSFTVFLPDFSELLFEGGGRFRYLYTHSEFSMADLKPAGQTNVSNFLDVVNEQLTGKKFNQPSCFFIQQDGTYYVGLFDKLTGFFEVLKYDE